jgi:thioredoxin reductase
VVRGRRLPGLGRIPDRGGARRTGCSFDRRCRRAVERVLAPDDRLLGVELEDGRIVELDALFVPPRFVPNDALLVELGCALDDDGWAVIDGTGRTSVPGVWVAGNVADARAQVITAAGEGSAAAIALNADLVADDVARALAAPEPASRIKTY